MNPIDLEISRHAAARWMERTGFTDPALARQKWEDTIGAAQPVDLKESQRLRALLRHGCRPATYLYNAGWVFVVVGDTVVTVHTNTADLLDTKVEPASGIPFVSDWTPPENCAVTLKKWCVLVDGKFKKSYDTLKAAEQAASDIHRLTGAGVALAVNA